MFTYFFIWGGFALLVGIVGKDKTIGFWGGFLLSLCLSPIIGLVIVLLSREKQEVAQTAEILQLQKQQTAFMSTMASSKTRVVSTSDELMKLKAMKDAGDISLDDYEIAVKRVLE